MTIAQAHAETAQRELSAIHAARHANTMCPTFRDLLEAHPDAADHVLDILKRRRSVDGSPSPSEVFANGDTLKDFCDDLDRAAREWADVCEIEI